MNIQKYFSQQKILSRRETDRYIRTGKIKVNGVIEKNPARQIEPEKDKVEIIGGVEEKTTILFNKPRGISSSKIESEGKNIFDLLPQFQHLNTVGRLDKESEGLIILSDDGTLTSIVTGQDHQIEKEYLVEVKEKLTQTKMNAMSKGMLLSDGLTLPARAEILSDNSFSLVLKEGRNHQVRRMANKVGLTILNLKRVQVGSLSLGNIPTGSFRQATKEEIQKLKLSAK